MIITNCDDCPCLNFDYDDGGSCNLDYKTAYYKLHIKETIVDSVGGSTDCGVDRLIGSTDCGLEIVRYFGGEYKPIKVTIIDNAVGG